MDVYLLFRILSIASILLSTCFDLIQILENYDIYLVLSFVFLFITSIIPSAIKHDPDFKQTFRLIVTDRDFYFVPSTMLILVFKAMALYNTAGNVNMTISFWSYIVGSFTAHYMKAPEYIDFIQKKTRRDFFIFKPLVLTFAFWLVLGIDPHTLYERAMKYVLIVNLAIYAYSEVLVLLINRLIMQYFCGLNRWVLVKPIQLISACISLGLASFFYTQTWIPIVCIFVVIYLTHLL